MGSDNGLSPGRHQAIIWTNAGILLNGPLRRNFSDTAIEIHTFSFKKMHNLKMLSEKIAAILSQLQRVNFKMKRHQLMHGPHLVLNFSGDKFLWRFNEAWSKLTHAWGVPQWIQLPSFKSIWWAVWQWMCRNLKSATNGGMSEWMDGWTRPLLCSPPSILCYYPKLSILLTQCHVWKFTHVNLKKHVTNYVH